MARKKVVEHHVLLSETEKLLLEKGYSAFHFGLLADRLGVGRSTIYEYYANKDVLITAYIHSFAYERVEECKKVLDIEDANEQLKSFLRIFVKYSHIQQVITMLVQMEDHSNGKVDTKPVRLLTKEIYRISLVVIQRLKDTGIIRRELDDTFISYIMFNLIQMPNFRNHNETQRLDEFVDFLLHGIGT